MGRRWPAWLDRALLAVILVIALAIRLRAIDRAPFWFDEGATLGMLRLPLLEFVRNAWDPYLNNQVLYYLLLRPWRVLGESEAILRGFSAACSVATVLVVFLLGRRLHGTRSGLVAAAAAAISAPAIIYAQEARGYALATLLVSLSALLLVRAQEGRRRADVLGWVVSGVLAAYAHFFAAFAVGAQVLALVALGFRDLRSRRDLLGGVAAIALGCIPILLFAFRAPIAAMDWVGPVDAARVAATAAWLAGGRAFLLTFLGALLGVVAVTLFDRRPERRWKAALILSWAVVPIGALAAISQVRPLLIPRYVVFSAPAWALAAGAVIGPLIDRRRLAPLGYALLGFLVISQVDSLETVSARNFEDWRTPAVDVARATRAGDAILYESPWTGLAFEYHLRGGPRQPDPLQRGALPFDGGFDEDELRMPGRVWLVLSRPDPATRARLETLLRASRRLVAAKQYGPVTVMLFE